MKLPSYRNFFITLVLLCLLSYFVAAFKLYFWTLFHGANGFDLETISAFLSLGSAVGFFAGPILVDRLGVRITTLFSIFLCIGGFFGGLLFGNVEYVYFVAGSCIVGAGWALWLVTKNVLLPVAIGETHLSDTVISGAANIVFTIFTIVGTVAGSYYAEKAGVKWASGLLYAVALAIPFAIYFREPKLEKIHATGYVSSVVKIIHEYFPYILSIALLWSVITALAQIFVEAGVDYFHETHTRASLLLLWATLGGVIGNVLSMQWQENRWKIYRFSLAVFAMLVFASIPLIEMFALMHSIIAFSILAVCIGFFFGVAVNLVEGYYFLKLETSPLKSYGAAVYGLVASVSIFLVMHLVLGVKSYSEGASLILSGGIILALLIISMSGAFGSKREG